MQKKPEVSVIIVKYRCEKYLPACLSSIGESPNWEVIVIDNDKENIGFGAGCNKGAEKAKGRYLFFLNPDTILLPGAIDRLVSFIKKNQVGIVAPLLLDKDKVPYPLQGTGKLTPLSAIFALSFLNKFWPNNPISRIYWLADWRKKEVKEVAVAPGPAFMIKREVFEEIDGFDENLFLYFEESDLCKRIKEKGWRIFINPSAKVIHFQGKCTPQNKEVKRIFRQSRFYCFQKHWGIFPAFIVESILRSGEWLAEKI